MSASVMVVDDEVIIARELEARLTTLGYRVVGLASSAAEAIELAERTRPALALMDIVLRGPLDGIDAAETLRRKWAIPVIYITAYADERTLARAKLTEPLGYIVKPFSERELHANIEMAMYKRETEARVRRLEARLDQSQRLEAVGQLAGGIAHDFNNLVTVIAGYGELVLEQPDLSERSRRAVEEIRKAGARATSLVRQLLAFGGRQVLVPKVVDVNAVVTGMEEMVRRLIREDIEVVLRLAPDAGRIRIDRGQLEQVILNLVVNARDAMPGGGRLVIETGSAGAASDDGEAPCGEVALSVIDTGIGMDAETRSRMFEPFFSTKPRDRGTGLGLATVYGIVTQSGGRLQVESEPGRGTTMRVSFPRVTAPVESEPVAPSARLRPGGGETVLLVEDEEALRELLREVLEAARYRVLAAADGPEALRVAAAHEGAIDLVVSDLVMPGMGGSEVARRLVETRPATRVLFVSGYSDAADAGQSIAASTSLLQKPFTPAALLGRVREVLGADPPPKAGA